MAARGEVPERVLGAPDERAVRQPVGGAAGELGRGRAGAAPARGGEPGTWRTRSGTYQASRNPVGTTKISQPSRFAVLYAWRRTSAPAATSRRASRLALPWIGAAESLPAVRKRVGDVAADHRRGADRVGAPCRSRRAPRRRAGRRWSTAIARRPASRCPGRPAGPSRRGPSGRARRARGSRRGRRCRRPAWRRGGRDTGACPTDTPRR